MIKHNWIEDEWFTEEYQKEKRNNFELIDKELSTPPLKILDIGCGFAWESRLFQKKHQSKLWLIDSEPDENTKVNEIGFHESADTFSFYYPLQFLKEKLDELGTVNYELINANNINLPKDLKFDLITSYKSCGFHYPVSTYRDIILNHSHDNTKVIFDLRLMKKELVSTEGYEVKKILWQGKKHICAEIKII
jgi:SAM-dependent methyltransferase